MMSNERQRQVSKPLVVAKDNLKNRQKQMVALCKTKQQNMKRQNNQFLPETAYPYNEWVGVDQAARTQCLEFSLNGRMKR